MLSAFFVTYEDVFSVINVVIGVTLNLVLGKAFLGLVAVTLVKVGLLPFKKNCYLVH